MNAEELNTKQESIAAAYGRLFSTRDGELILKDLQARFKNKPIASDDFNKTVIRAAKHDVIMQIENLIKVGT